MKILIDIGHPAHVHLFKHFAWQMQNRGHKVLFTVRDKEYEIALLQRYGFCYKSFGKHFKTKFGKFFGMFLFDFKMVRTAFSFKPEIFLSHGSVYSAHTSWLLRKVHIALEDTGNMEQVRLYLPFTTAVLTSGVFHRDFGAKQIRYNGYHELAYLHPKRFSANKQIRKLLGVTEKENYFLLRFVSWNASHDKGKERISIKDKRDLINFLSKHGRVFITTEDLIDNEFEKFKIVLPPEMIHDVLSEAYIFIGEGATMASECAILGTPAIYINSLEAGTIDDQEEQGLLFHFRSFDGVLDKLVDLLNEENLKGKFRIKRNKMMRDKIDVTAFLVWFVEEFPGSSILMKKNPEYQNNFR